MTAIGAMRRDMEIPPGGVVHWEEVSPPPVSAAITWEVGEGRRQFQGGKPHLPSVSSRRKPDPLAAPLAAVIKAARIPPTKLVMPGLDPLLSG